MSMSNYPNGFRYGLTVRNQPILSTHSGNIFWVGKTPEGQAGSNGYDGTYNWPFATIDFAIGKCAASHGDIIVVKAGHTETVIAASDITADMAGVSIIGLGSGADRPKITFSTDVAASVVISAASVTIENIVGISGIDGLTKPFDVTGSDCHLDIEWQDASATVEAARAVLATTVSRLFVKIKHLGFIAGNACVNVVRLVEVAGARIVVDVYGEISTGIVEMVTTASTDVLVTGYFYNDNVALTKNVVNTGGLACTWYAFGYDGKGGYSFSGGSTTALAADDIGDLAAAVAVVDGYFDVPVADAAGNTTMRDVIGIKTDAAAAGAVSNVESLMAYAKQLVTEGIARDVLIAALGTKGICRLGKNLAAAAITGTTTQFTVSGGPIRVLAMGVLVTTALPAGINTLQFSFTPTGGGATNLSGATETALAAVQSFFMLDGVKLTGPVKTTDPGILAGGQLLVSAGQGIVLSTGVIQTIFSAGPPATGAITVFIEYEPLVVGAIVA
jgi:hypothetical protein